jgi:hypothetical protein
VLSAIYGDDHQWLRDYVARKLDERRAQRRRTG